MLEACRLAQADEFIQQFPDKYDTWIEQGGSNISGGQKQRLCIARALLKKPKVLILDDSTSAVDTRTDALIRQGFRKFIPETTKIIIAQRVASVQDADRIIVMDGGHINDIGTHEELMKPATRFIARFIPLRTRQVTKMAKDNPNTATPATTARGQRAPKGVLRRLMRLLFEFYPVLLPVALVCILFNAVVSSMPAVFLQNIIAIVDSTYKSGDWASVSARILGLVGILVVMYVLSLIAGFTYTQLMAIITQGSLKKLREKMFSHMQDLPIKYFDTNGHGDIMSYYTNDVDTLRQMISQSLPQMLISCITLLSVLCIMMYYSAILGVIVVAGVVCMFFAARYITSHSSKYFLRQQVTIAKAEAFMEEMMTGQKVIKVFCHEDAARADFDKVNGEIFFSMPATVTVLPIS